MLTKTSKVLIDVNPRYIFSSQKSTFTISLADDFNNLVVVEKPVSITLTADSGKFTVITGTDNKTDTGYSPFSFTMTTPQQRVYYTGIKSGNIRINANSDGLLSGRDTITVYYSSSVSSIKIETSSVAFVPSTLSLMLYAVDENDNLIPNCNMGVDLNCINNSNDDRVLSANVNLVNGIARFNVPVNEPGIYMFTVSTDTLQLRTASVFCIVNKTNYSVLRSKTQVGEIKLVVLPNTLNDNIMIEIKKYSDNIIELVPKDNQGYPYTDEAIVTGKSIELTIPYGDFNQDGIVDGTEFKEENLRVWYFENEKWVIPNFVKYKAENYRNYTVSADNNVIDKDQNNVAVHISKLGKYKITGVSTEPTINDVVVYPNPFTDNATISFNIGSDGDVKLDIYTISGRLINTLTKTVASGNSGLIEFSYDGTDNKGQQIANGMYLYKITTKNSVKEYLKTGKLTRIK
jgi:hypothetical protein